MWNVQGNNGKVLWNLDKPYFWAHEIESSTIGFKQAWRCSKLDDCTKTGCSCEVGYVEGKGKCKPVNNYFILSTVFLPVLFIAVLLCVCYNGLNFCYVRQYAPKSRENRNQRKRIQNAEVKPNLESARVKVRNRNE